MVPKLYYVAGKWACPSMGHHVAKKYVETILAKVVVGKMTFCLGDHNNDLKDIFLKLLKFENNHVQQKL